MGIRSVDVRVAENGVYPAPRPYAEGQNARRRPPFLIHICPLISLRSSPTALKSTRILRSSCRPFEQCAVHYPLNIKAWESTEETRLRPSYPSTLH